MKQILIDSHVFIWLLYEPQKIGKQSLELLQSSEKVWLSIISLWELTLKHNLGKLKYSPVELKKGISALNIALLDLKVDHIVNLSKIAIKHNDPFDNLLLAQSEYENYQFLTADLEVLKLKHDSVNVLL